MASISDAQRIQHSWLRALASSTGGKAFGTHKTDWVWLPTQQLVVGMFPQTISEAGIRPALAEAARLGATSVELWLNASTRANELLEMGFSLGRQPWWMTLKLADTHVVAAQCPASPAGFTVMVEDESEGLSGSYLQELAVNLLTPRVAWHAVARVDADLAGHGYLHQPSINNGRTIGGIFDMYVWPDHRRGGVGTALLDTLAAAAAENGLTELVLNASPDGEKLFTSYGFELMGRGQTYRLKL